MRTHHLKTWPSFFTAIWNGEKKFELRVNDRDFAKGDELVLFEWDPSKCGGLGNTTGRQIRTIVEYVLHGGAFGLDGKSCIMSFNEIERNTTP